MKRNIFSSLAAAAVILSAAIAKPADAASVVTNGTDIKGVTGISYNGTLYDATFVSGTCAATFVACGGQTAPFAFTTSTTADGIAQKLATQDPPVTDLLSLVLAGDTVDGYATADLNILTPYSVSTTVSAAVDVITSGNGHASIAIAPDETVGIGAALSGPPGLYAIWTAESTATPEPASAALLAIGAAAAVFHRKRKA